MIHYMTHAHSRFKIKISKNKNLKIDIKNAKFLNIDKHFLFNIILKHVKMYNTTLNTNFI